MVDVSVYPRSLNFGRVPAGVQSVPKWVHLCNYQTGQSLEVDDWGIKDHFISRRPLLQTLNPASNNHIKTNSPASGNSKYILSHGDYVFEANSSTGIGVFLIDSAGSTEEVSRLAGVTATAQMYHDGRFLFVPTADGLFVLKVDPFGNLLIKDFIKPNAVTITGVHGCGDYVLCVDSVGVTVLSVDHNGEITQIDSQTLANCIGVSCREGEVFVIVTATSKLHAYIIDASGNLTFKKDYTFSFDPENITIDNDYIYVNLTNDDLNSITYDSVANTLTVEDTVSLPLTSCYQLFFDGGYVHAVLGNYIQSYSVDRTNGDLAEVMKINSFSSELLVDGDMEAGSGPEELTDGDMETGPGPEELTDGDMEAAGTSAYTAGNSATLSKVTGTPHGGLQSLRVSYNGVTNPYAYQTVMVAGRSFHVEGWARGDGSVAPQVQNGATILWTGIVSSSWQNFSINCLAVAASARFYALATAGGNCDFDDVSIRETAPDWNPGGSALITKETGTPHGGSQSLRVSYTGTSYPYAEQSILVAGRSYHADGYARSDGVYTPRLREPGGTTHWSGTTDTNWQHFEVDFVAGGSDIALYAGATGSGYCDFDNISIKETCPDWTPANNPLLTKETITPYEGSQCLRIASTGTGSEIAYQTILTIGKRYRITGAARTIGSGGNAAAVRDGTIAWLWTGTTNESTWESFDEIFVAQSTSVRLYNRYVATGYVEFDAVSVKEITSDARSFWTDGETIYTAEDSLGIGVYDFNDSRERYPVYYTPLGYNEYNGRMSVHGYEIDLKGESPSDFDPYLVPNSESVTLEADRRWDKIAFDFFGNFDRVEDVKHANPLIPTEIKARSFVPRGAIVYKPTDAETEQNTIGAANWRRA